MISGLYLEGAHWKSGSGLIEKDTSTEDKYIVMPGIVCYAAKVRRKTRMPQIHVHVAVLSFSKCLVYE